MSLSRFLTAGTFLVAFFISEFSFSQNSWNMTRLDSWVEPGVSIRYNDCWGYVDTQGREYAILGSRRATYFLDVTTPTSINHIATFDGRNLSTTWRDFKVYSHYAFGVSDGGGGSLQIFDLQYLPDSVIKIFDHDSLGENTHNIQVWGSRLYMIDNKGTDSSGNYQWPIRVVDISDPTTPKTMGGFFDVNYNQAHDIYVINDTVYLSVYGASPHKGLQVYDFTDATNPINIGSLTSYPEGGLNHSSWGTPDRQTLVMCDELHGAGVKTVDISNPANMTTLSVFRTFPGALAHNPFVLDTLVFISYDHDGLQVWSIKDPVNPFHVGYYYTDTTTGAAAGGDYAGFEGCWGVYPYFPSGTIIASDRNNGLITLTLDAYSPPTALFEGAEEEQIAVYPNPSNGRITLALRNAYDEDLKVSILELSGNEVYSAFINARFGNYDFDLSELPKGMYVMHVLGRSIQESKKLLID